MGAARAGLGMRLCGLELVLLGSDLLGICYRWHDHCRP